MNRSGANPALSAGIAAGVFARCLRALGACIIASMPALASQPSALRWRMLALLFACRASLGLQFQTLASTADPLVARFGIGYTEIGTLIGLFMLPGLFLSLPAGAAGRHASDRRLVSLGLALMALGGLIAALADGFGTLALARLVCGAGFVFSTLYFTKMVVDWFSGRELATALGILVMSWPFGIAAGQVGHAWLAATFDWRAPFAIAAVCNAVAAAAVAWAYRPPAAVGAAEHAQVNRLPRDELLLTLLAAAAWGLFNAGYVVYLSFAPKVLQTQGYASTQAAAVISIASWVMILSVTFIGRIADRTGRHGTVLCLCMAVAVASLLLLRHAEWSVALSLAFGLLGMAPAGIIMALTAQSMAPQRRAFGMGVFLSVYFVIQTAAPALAGWMFDRSGEPFVAIRFAAGLFAATAVCHIGFGWFKRRLARA